MLVRPKMLRAGHMLPKIPRPILIICRPKTKEEMREMEAKGETGKWRRKGRRRRRGRNQRINRPPQKYIFFYFYHINFISFFFITDFLYFFIVIFIISILLVFLLPIFYTFSLSYFFLSIFSYYFFIIDLLLKFLYIDFY